MRQEDSLQEGYLQFVIQFEEKSALEQRATALMLCLEDEAPALWTGEEGCLEGIIEAKEKEFFIEKIRKESKRLGATLKEIHFSVVESSREWLEQEQAGLPPLSVGDIFIYGPSHEEREHEGKSSLLIDSPEAFGSGHHPTTRSCIELLQKALKQMEVNRALDVGCGSGILALVIAKLRPEAEVIACDNDESCVEAAEANRDKNGIKNIKVCLNSDQVGENDFCLCEGTFDLIVANIHSNTLISLVSLFREKLSEEGRLILSGLLKEQGEELVGIYRESGFCVSEEREVEGWLTLMLEKRL